VKVENNALPSFFIYEGKRGQATFKEIERL